MPSTPLTAEKRWYPEAEASDYTGLTGRTLRKYVSQGRLRAYRIGPRQIRYDVADLDALLEPIPADTATVAAGGGAR